MKRFYTQTALAFLVVLLFLSSGFSQDDRDFPMQSKWEVFAVDQEKTPGYQAMLLLWIIPDEGLYTYAHDPGPAGFPTVLTITDDPTESLEVFYPPGEEQPDPFDPSQTSEVFPEERTPIFIPLPADIPLEGILTAELSLLLCSDRNCWPVHKEIEFDLDRVDPAALDTAQEQDWWSMWQNAGPATQEPMMEMAPPAPADPDADETRWDFEVRSQTPGLEVDTLAKAALLAMIAGFILNFTPCVLPVISLKLRGMLTLEEDSGIDAQKRAFRKHNIFFALGMLIFFSVLAVVLSLTGMAWGQLFQSPGAILVLGCIIFALSLSLFGLYDLPVIDLKSRTRDPWKNPNAEALSTGMLATFLATPCSGPFLGGVLAWTLTQPPAIIGIVLWSMGLGMALPYLLMAVFPFMLRFLPRPGPWTMYLEKILGFFLLATCVYLMSLIPEDMFVKALIMFLVIAFAAWMWGHWTDLKQSNLRRRSIRLSALVLVALAAFLLFRPAPEHPVAWTPFEEQQFEEMLGRENILLEFTADWCPNCKFLEQTVLTPGFMAENAERYGLQFVRIDLTQPNPPGEEMLRALDSQSIPLVAIFSRDNPDSPLILRDMFTRSQIDQALEQELD
ncbi:Protein-disulfide reductase [Desulfonatronospira thiodismutans ASO3-1]|uniref:Protein-disulfide reductase n=1 Tax=Desulfonatronospira thiodismutans ASO3-1 TaxID=555779 RepID=D6SLI8_9BACT|nr:cytochrome c biogenesis protein CcdA [Desulfonatronospira thiodismutans]EFI35549.1 Protein-disulfide reductase [Desulfonatronospira thiodismutans ASO3-1]